MALSSDILIERTQLKSKLALWRLIAILSIFAIVVFFAIREKLDLSESEDAPYIAYVKIEGMIIDDEYRQKKLEDIARNDNIKALLVIIDSPGGTVVGGEQLYYSLNNITSEKPVIVLMRTMATSAAYMASLGAERIYAMKGSITGSVGVIFQTIEVTEAMDSLGLKPISIKSHPLKAAPSPFEKASEESLEISQDVVDSFQEFFVGLVKEKRNLDDNAINAIKTGRIFTGSQAVNLGLVDELGGKFEAIDYLAKQYEMDTQNIPVKEVSIIPPEEEWLKRLSGAIAGGVVSNIIPDEVSLSGLISVSR